MTDSKQLAEAAKAKGNAAFSAKNFEEAITHFTEAITHDPTNHVFFSNRSACHASLGNFDTALEDANKCIECKPDWAKGYGRKGSALQGKGDYVGAEEAFSKGLEVEPDNDICKRGLADVQKAGSSGIHNVLGGMFQDPMLLAKLAMNPKTKAFCEQPDFVQILSELRANPQSLATHLKDQRVMTVLTEFLGGGGGGGGPFGGAPPPSASSSAPPPRPAPKKEEAPPAPAKPDLTTVSDEDALAMTPQEQAQRQKEFGNKAYKAKKFEEAIAYYTQAIALDPLDISFLTNRAAVHFEKKDYDACIADSKKAVEVGKENHAEFKAIGRAYQRLGNALMKKEDWDAAIDAFERSLCEHRSDEVNRSLLEAKKRKKARDTEAYQDPVKAEEEKQAGNEHFKAAQYPEAIARYTEALKRNPKDHTIYSNRAACFTKLGDFGAGMKDCDLCIELCPSFVKAYIRKGNLHIFMKELHKALETFDKGLALDPENAELLDGRRKVVYQINQAQGSGEADEERIKRGMQDPEIQGIMRDPIMSQVLQDLQTDPKSAQHHLKNPEVMGKLEKLVAAGIIRLG